MRLMHCIVLSITYCTKRWVAPCAFCYVLHKEMGGTLCILMKGGWHLVQ